MTNLTSYVSFSLITTNSKRLEVDDHTGIEKSMGIRDKYFSKAIIEKKLRIPKIRSVDPLYFTVWGYLTKCFRLSPSELTRILTRYKLTSNSMYILFTPAISTMATKVISSYFLDFMADLNVLSNTEESRKIYFLVEEYFNPTSRILNDQTNAESIPVVPVKEVPTLDHFEAISDSRLGESTTPDSPSLQKVVNLTKIEHPNTLMPQPSTVIPPVPLLPTLSPILVKVFGFNQIPDKEVFALVDLVRQQGFSKDNIGYITDILSPITQIGLTGFMALYLVRQKQEDHVLDFLEGQLRELSVTQPDYFKSVYIYLSSASSMPLNKAQGPLGYFTADQRQRFGTIAKMFTPLIAAMYFASFLTKVVDKKFYYTHPKLNTPIPNIELYIFILSLIVNIEFDSPKRVIWSDFIQNLNDLTEPAPRISELSVEVTQPN